MTLDNLLALIPAQKHEKVKKFLEQKTADLPVIIKVLLGFGAVVSAGFFFAALSAAVRMLAYGEIQTIALTVGIVLMLGSIVLYNFVTPKFGVTFRFFAEQVLLVAMLFSRVCIFAGAIRTAREWDWVVLLFVMAAVPYMLFRNTADRFISVLAFVIGFYLQMFVFKNYFGIYNTDIIFISFVLSAIIFAVRKNVLYPIAWALCAGMIIPTITGMVTTKSIHGVPYMVVMFNMYKGCLAVFLSVFITALAYQQGKLNKYYIAAPFALFAVMLPFNLPIIYGVIYLLIGQYFRDIKIKILSYAVLTGGIIYLYYNLDTTLLAKSVLLMASGAVVLAAYYLIKRFNYAR
ncbi:hypothetical protein AAIR98_001823 [Elusimicrobium simillimum]|uniref:DUF4401 domain-containing protein n=1 Tax=Elusimicrobium simillimum TaxID=3143438 RepID=UPI003C6F4608